MKKIPVAVFRNGSCAEGSSIGVSVTSANATSWISTVGICSNRNVGVWKTLLEGPGVNSAEV